MNNKIVGALGEKIARDFLEKNKFKILDTNFHYSKIAEIDIIAEKNKILHFIEVKTRSSNAFGTPFEAINKKKIFSIFQAGNYYIQQKNNGFKKFQIDVIGIVLDTNNHPEISFLENISI